MGLIPCGLLWIFFRKYNLPGLTLGGGKQYLYCSVVRLPALCNLLNLSEFDCLLDGQGELSPVSVESLIDLRVGEMFSPVPYINSLHAIFSTTMTDPLSAFRKTRNRFCLTSAASALRILGPIEIIFQWFQWSLLDYREKGFPHFLYKSFQSGISRFTRIVPPFSGRVQALVYLYF